MQVVREGGGTIIGNDGGAPPLMAVPSLLDAVKSNSLDSVNFLVSSNPSCIHEKGPDNVTALHLACLDNFFDIVYLLVHKGANLNIETEKEGHTPLDWACIAGHLKMVLFLISMGANVNHLDRRGYHLLHHAAMYDRNDIAFYLLNEYKLDIDMKDLEGHTPFMWASYMGFVTMMELLIRHHCNVKAADNDGNTSLHWAAVKGHLHAVEVIISSGAVINATDRTGRTPFDESKRKNFLIVSEYIKKAATYPAFAKGGRATGNDALFFMPMLYLPWVFLSYIYSPYTVIAFFSALLPWPVFWKYLGSILWIPNDEGRNPFWIGIFIGSYFLSIAIYLTELVDLSQLHHKIFIFINIVWFAYYIKLLYQDPGSLPKNSVPVKEILTAMKVGKGNQYCTTCMLKKPPRSKHCRSTGRCVARFDHYCPWINNTVGWGNHRLFFMCILGLCVNHIWFLKYSFNLLSLTLTDDISIVRTIPYLYRTEPCLIVFSFYHILFTFWQFFNLSTTFYSVLVNVTTNENINKTRYAYLWKNHKFWNMYDRGYLGNLKEFFLRDRNYLTLTLEDV